MFDNDPAFISGLVEAINSNAHRARGVCNSTDLHKALGPAWVRNQPEKLLVVTSRSEFNVGDLPKPYVLLVDNQNTLRRLRSHRSHHRCKGVFMRSALDMQAFLATCDAVLKCTRKPVAESAIIGESEAMRRVREFIALAAGVESTVLLTGETGTGKDLVAGAIHEASQRPGIFCAINCAALPEALLESELFGHAKGSFTGASRDYDGLFLQADNGTVFLDEIDSMPLAIQAKLLRFLQDRHVRRVGTSSHVKTNVRVLAASLRPLKHVILHHPDQFRADLYYRLAVLTCTVPPLRERGDDVGLLAEYFAKRHAKKANRSLPVLDRDKLKEHTWPGNVRELENVMERLVVTGRLEF